MLETVAGIKIRNPNKWVILHSICLRGKKTDQSWVYFSYAVAEIYW